MLKMSSYADRLLEGLDETEFMEKINWFGNKQILEKILSLAIKNEVFFKSEKIDKF